MSRLLLTIIFLVLLLGVATYGVYSLRRKKKEVSDGSDFEIKEE